MSGLPPGGYNDQQQQQQQQQQMYHQQMLRQQQQQQAQERQQQLQHYQMLQHPQLMHAQNQSPANNSRSATPTQQQNVLQPHQERRGPSPQTAYISVSNLNQQQQGSPSTAYITVQNLSQANTPEQQQHHALNSHSKPSTPQMHTVHSSGHLSNMNPMSVPLAAISRPASVAPPSSLPPNLHVTNPGSVQAPGSIQRPGSVLAPSSVPPQNLHAPGSVQPPGSVQNQMSIQNPGSVQNPMSIQNPGSVQNPMSIQNPGSVQNPMSIQNPGSVQNPMSIQNPGSVQNPMSIQGPGSNLPQHLSHGPSSIAQPSSVVGPSSVQGSGSAMSFRPTDEQMRSVQDPVVLLRALIANDLRASIVEVNRRCANLLKNQRDDSEEFEDDLLEQYKRAYNDFLAIVDEIDRTLTTILETNKQLGKLEKVLLDKNQMKNKPGMAPDHTGGLMNSVTSFIENTSEVQRMFDSTIGSVTETMEKIRRRQAKFQP